MPAPECRDRLHVIAAHLVGGHGMYWGFGCPHEQDSAGHHEDPLALRMATASRLGGQPISSAVHNQRSCLFSSRTATAAQRAPALQDDGNLRHIRCRLGNVHRPHRRPLTVAWPRWLPARVDRDSALDVVIDVRIDPAQQLRERAVARKHLGDGLNEPRRPRLRIGPGRRRLGWGLVDQPEDARLGLDRRPDGRTKFSASAPWMADASLNDRWGRAARDLVVVRRPSAVSAGGVGRVRAWDLLDACGLDRRAQDLARQDHVGIGADDIAIGVPPARPLGGDLGGAGVCAEIPARDVPRCPRDGRRRGPRRRLSLRG